MRRQAYRSLQILPVRADRRQHCLCRSADLIFTRRGLVAHLAAQRRLVPKKKQRLPAAAEQRAGNAYESATNLTSSLQCHFPYATASSARAKPTIRSGPVFVRVAERGRFTTFGGLIVRSDRLEMSRSRQQADFSGHPGACRRLHRASTPVSGSHPGLHASPCMARSPPGPVPKMTVRLPKTLDVAFLVDPFFAKNLPPPHNI